MEGNWAISNKIKMRIQFSLRVSFQSIYPINILHMVKIPIHKGIHHRSVHTRQILKNHLNVHQWLTK